MLRRIAFLDGLRGVAVSLVVLYHYYGPTYVSFMPYGSRYDLPVIQQGSGGVELFFMISGFVILMTLDRCSDFREFIRRRWLRLFPAMLLATVLLLAFNSFGFSGPDSGTSSADAIPGLTFIHPALWQTALRHPFHSLDGVFWSLYAEAGFYVVFGTLYFSVGRDRAVAWLIPIWIAALLAFPHVPTFAGKLIEASGARWFGWFAAGAVFYRAHEDQWLFWPAIVIGVTGAFLTSSIIGGEPWKMRLMLVAMVALFASAQRSEGLQQLLSGRLLLFIGAISYPLYLLHSHIGLATVNRLGWNNPLAPLVPLAAIVPVCWLCVRYYEPAAKKQLALLLDRSPLRLNVPA